MEDERPIKEKVQFHEFLIPGTLVRPFNDWCVTCAKPSMWEGPIWHLRITGVAFWGWIEGCDDCGVWTRTKGGRKNA